MRALNFSARLSVNEILGIPSQAKKKRDQLDKTKGREKNVFFSNSTISFNSVELKDVKHTPAV